MGLGEQNVPERVGFEGGGRSTPLGGNFSDGGNFFGGTEMNFLSPPELFAVGGGDFFGSGAG